MDIFFLVRTLARAGAELQLLALAEGLAARGHRVRVGVFYACAELEEHATQRGVTILHLDKRGRWDLPGFILRLALLMRRDPPEVLHAYLGTANILSVLLKPLLRSLARTVHIVWSMRASCMDLTPYGWAARWSWAIERRLARFADMTIANSEAGKRYAVAQGFPEPRTLVVPNGLDCDRFAPDAEARARQRGAWRVTNDHVLVGLVGRTDPVKGHEHFLRAAALATQQHPEMRLVCIGDDPTGRRQALDKLAGDLGLANILHWTGPTQDMPAAYNALDLLCQASLSEGFSNVLGEAMACGVPCVATDVGDSAAILRDLGTIVPPCSPDELAQGLTVMIQRLAREGDGLRTACRERIVSNFGLERMVTRTESLLLDMIQR